MSVDVQPVCECLFILGLVLSMLGIVMSSAYNDMFRYCGGVGVSRLCCMYKLNSVGKKTKNCGTPFDMLYVRLLLCMRTVIFYT